MRSSHGSASGAWPNTFSCARRLLAALRATCFSGLWPSVPGYLVVAPRIAPPRLPPSVRSPRLVDASPRVVPEQVYGYPWVSLASLCWMFCSSGRDVQVRHLAMGRQASLLPRFNAGVRSPERDRNLVRTEYESNFAAVVSAIQALQANIGRRQHGKAADRLHTRADRTTEGRPKRGLRIGRDPGELPHCAPSCFYGHCPAVRVSVVKSGSHRILCGRQDQAVSGGDSSAIVQIRGSATPVFCYASIHSGSIGRLMRYLNCGGLSEKGGDLRVERNDSETQCTTMRNPCLECNVNALGRPPGVIDGGAVNIGRPEGRVAEVAEAVVQADRSAGV